jgi:vacuolar-type H+-ATPase subunit I/STV1
MGIAMLSQPEAFATLVHAFVADAPLVLIAGVFTLFGGLAFVLLHNFWSGSALTVIITLAGWLTSIKAVVLVVLPSAKLVAMYSGVNMNLPTPNVFGNVACKKLAVRWSSTSKAGKCP